MVLFGDSSALVLGRLLTANEFVIVKLTSFRIHSEYIYIYLYIRYDIILRSFLLILLLLDY